MSLSRILWSVKVTHVESGQSLTTTSRDGSFQSPREAVAPITKALLSRVAAPRLPAHEYTYEADEQYPADLLKIRIEAANEN